MDSCYPGVYLDWDYHTFVVVDTNGNLLFLYEDFTNVEIITVEGFLWPGKSIPPTQYRRVPEFTSLWQRIPFEMFP